MLSHLERGYIKGVEIIGGHRPTPFECIETTWITPVCSVCLIWDTGNTDRLERGKDNCVFLCIGQSRRDNTGRVNTGQDNLGSQTNAI